MTSGIAYLRLWGLFLLGSGLPLVAFLILIPAGIGIVLSAPQTGSLLLGGFLFINGVYGVGISFKSFPIPRGRVLTTAEAPEILELVQSISSCWKAPSVRSVTIDPNSWDVDLMGVPTLGLLGWTRFRWVIGVLPMLALSQREFEALAGWQAVWWCNQHSWLNLQTKRLAAYWRRMDNHFKQPSLPGKLALHRTFSKHCSHWMAQRFDSFLIGECLATDEIISREFGSSTLARALCRMALLEPLVACRIFEGWSAKIQKGDALPDHPYRIVHQELSRWPENVDGLLDYAMEVHDRQMIADRLVRLGQNVSIPIPSSSRAVMELLEGTSAFVELEDEWRKRLEGFSSATLEGRKRDDDRFEELRRWIESDFPHHPDSFEFLCLARTRLAPDTYTSYLQQFRENHQAHVDSRFLEARLLLAQERTAEAECVLVSIVQDRPCLLPEKHFTMVEYHQNKQDFAAMEEAWILGRRAEVTVEQAQQERKRVTLKDSVEPHGCTQEEIQRIVGALATNPKIKEAFLVRKSVVHIQEWPALLLVVRWNRPWWDPDGSRTSKFRIHLAESIPFPANATGFFLVHSTLRSWWVRNRLQRMGALIYRCDPTPRRPWSK